MRLENSGSGGNQRSSLRLRREKAERGRKGLHGCIIDITHDEEQKKGVRIISGL